MKQHNLLHVLQVCGVFLGFSTFSVTGTVDCPFLCLCDGEIRVMCSGTKLFPGVIPSATKEIEFHNVNFTSIPMNAFKNLNNLEVVSFINSTIHTVGACSFAQTKNVHEVLFRSCNISVLQANSFSNIVNVTALTFIGSRIDEILSYAFQNLKDVDTLTFQGCMINIVHSYAFQNLTNVELIEIKETAINKFSGNGFSLFKNVRNVMVGQKSQIGELQCKTLDTVMTSGGHLEIRDTLFTCDCKLAWAWTQFGSFKNLSDEPSNLCKDSNQLLRDIGIDDLCPTKTSRKQGCQIYLPSPPHTCSSGSDEYEPISKVTFPSYFSKTPPSGSVETVLSSTFVLVLSLSLLIISLFCY